MSSEIANTAFATKIVAALSKLAQDMLAMSPDAQHNMGRKLSEAYVWDTIEKVAKGRSDGVWKSIVGDGADYLGLDPGEHEAVGSPHFVCKLKISEPIRRFNGPELAKLLSKSKFKVPVPIANQFIEKAKVPGNSSKTWSITEV